MYFIKLKRFGIKDYLYKVVASNFLNAQLLLLFLDDYYSGKFESAKKAIEDPLETEWTGNSTALDKRENNIIALSFLFDQNEAYAEIPSKPLLKIMDDYWLIAGEHPQEIIIRFDDTHAIIESR